MNNSKFANHPELVPDINWKKWTHDNLASSSNLYVTDIDCFIRSRGGCFILVEIKRRNAKVCTWQKLSLGLLATLLKQAEGTTLEANEYIMYPMRINRFCGVQELVFENTWFDDGKVYLNGIESSEARVKFHLSFGTFCKSCLPQEEHCHCGNDNLG